MSLDMGRDESTELLAGVTWSSSVLVTIEGEDSVDVGIKDDMGVVGGLVLVSEDIDVSWLVSSLSESSQC